MTFALSMGLVFMSALTQQTSVASGESKLAQIIGDVKDGCLDTGMGELCLDNGLILGALGDDLASVFNYLVINIFGIAILWTVVFAAFKTSKLTSSVAETVKGFAEKGLSSLEVIPLPGGQRVGVGAVSSGLQSYASQLPAQVQAQQARDVSNKIRV